MYQELTILKESVFFLRNSYYQFKPILVSKQQMTIQNGSTFYLNAKRSSR